VKRRNTKQNGVIKMNLDDFIKMVLANVKTKKWLNGRYVVDGREVGIKAFGLWVHRIEFNGVIESIPEQTTQKALKIKLLDLLK
jgi:hypothetical protein